MSHIYPLSNLNDFLYIYKKLLVAKLKQFSSLLRQILNLFSFCKILIHSSCHFKIDSFHMRTFWIGWIILIHSSSTLFVITLH